MTQKPKSLVDRLPRKGNDQHLRSTYVAFSSAMTNDVHPFVTQNANIVDKGYLTDHGPAHIQRVIECASKIVSFGNGDLNAYECFVLLIAINYHDIGNSLGRFKHEEKIGEVLAKFFSPLSFDELDRFLATEIASKHGGDTNGNKDKINELERETKWRGNDVRPQLLASILKFSDEIAETRDRADVKALSLGTLKGHEAEIFHVFAAGINSLEPDFRAGSIHYKFFFKKCDFERTYSKGAVKAELLDYIYERSVKSYFEAIYCSKYAKGFFYFDRVSVQVEVYSNEGSRKLRDLTYVVTGPSVYPDGGGKSDFENFLRADGRPKCPSPDEFRKELAAGEK
jgi:hypothetical protein